MKNLKINYLITADQSILDESGKVSAIGIFDKIRATNVPALHPKFSLIINLSGTEGDEYNNCQVEILDKENSKQLAIGKLDKIKFTDGPKISFVVDFANILFPHFGEYPFKISIDDKVLTTENDYVFVEKV